jgi:hypothetical protein
MKIKSLVPLLLLGFVASAPLPTKSPAPMNAVTGDYLEARTASVFCGPCHYNGELITDGRQAILAWNIATGQWNGVNLAGVRAMASVTCDDNLSNKNAARSWELVIDPSATPAQSAALTDMVRARAAAQLGTLTATRSAKISFAHDSNGYVVTADGFADMTVHPMPDDRCCSEPHNVWYAPLTPIEHRKVGYTQSADYLSATNGTAWERSDENSAFYGNFCFVQK